MKKEEDILFLHQALELAKIRRGFCAPNPSVGAVIVKDGDILATGYHFAAGYAHAEIDALNKLNNKAKGATIYVTLEPCCHHGKTPPCTNALIAAGIERVVYAYQDPNPIVAGKGKDILLSANLQIEHLSLPEIDHFYKSYHYWHQHRKPYVTAKLAMTLDGKIAGLEGQPIQITSKSLNELTHQSRKNCDAILTTAKTIRHDNPQLNARLNKEVIPKPLYIIDAHLNTPLDAQIFKTAQAITIFHGKASEERLLALKAQGAHTIYIESTAKGLNLNQVIETIGKEGIHDLWVEAGSHCFNSLFEYKLLQRALIYIAPWAMHDGISAFSRYTDFRDGDIYWQQFGKDVLCEIIW